MPAPWLMARASGLYCRVFVPADLRPFIGQRFLIRSLGSRDKDQARLIAAHYALAIGDLFCRLRKELSVPEPKISDIIQAIKSGRTRDLTLKGLTAANGTKVDEVIIENAADAKLFKEHFGDVFQSAPATQHPPKYRRMSAHGVLTSVRQAQYQTHLAPTHPKYQKSSMRVIQMLIDICGDLPPDDYEPDIVDHFIERLKFLPLNPQTSIV